MPNIRFNVSKSIGLVYPSLIGATAAKAREVLEKMAGEDTDFDSKFYAQKALEAIAAGQ